MDDITPMSPEEGGGLSRAPSPALPPMTGLPQLPPAAAEPLPIKKDNDNDAAPQPEPEPEPQPQPPPPGAAATAGRKRDAAEMSPKVLRGFSFHPKKPRDERLRECFTIAAEADGKESVRCRYCPEYYKVLQKFNPTKAREHLTDSCTGADEELKQILRSTTQAAKRLLLQGQGSDGAAAAAAPAAAAAAGTSAPTVASVSAPKKVKGRTSVAYMSFHTEDTSLDVTASIVAGQLILRLMFPIHQLQLNFDAQKNSEGAAVCIDGFMNTKADASWTAALYSMTNEGTRAGPHCQWPLGAEALEAGTTRVHKVQHLLKVMTMS